MVFGTGSKLVPVLVLANLWTLTLLFLAWNHGARYGTAQSLESVEEPLGVSPERMKWGVHDDSLSPVHHKPKQIEVAKEAKDAVVTVSGPVFPARDPNLPAFCPECGEGDLLCHKYGSVPPNALHLRPELPAHGLASAF
jgi:hypothetical protein